MKKERHRGRVAHTAATMSPGQLTSALRSCGYSKQTARAAADVFGNVVAALSVQGFAPPPSNTEVLSVLEEVHRLTSKLT